MNKKNGKWKYTNIKKKEDKKQEEESNFQDEYKIVFVGESGIGAKTSLISRLVKLKSDKYNLIANDASFTKIKINLENNKEVIFHFWDTIGLETNRPLVNIYFQDSDCIVIGYDITNKKSFEEVLKYWYPKSKEYDTCKLKYLIGNKIDLNEKRVIKKEVANEFAKLEKLRFFEISCMTDEDIKVFFDDLVYNLIKQWKFIINEYSIFINSVYYILNF